MNKCRAYISNIHPTKILNVKNNCKNLELKKDILIIEFNSVNDIINSYFNYQKKLKDYIDDILELEIKDNLLEEYNWINLICEKIINENLFDTFHFTLKNCIYERNYLIYYCPQGLFESNNILPIQNWNNLIFYYPFINNKINDELNQILFILLKYNDSVVDNESYELNNYDVKFINKKIININPLLLPIIRERTCLIKNYISPLLFDVNKLYTNLNKINNDSIRKRAKNNLFKDDGFNMSIIWFYNIENVNYTKKLTKDIFFPTSRIERFYYLNMIRFDNNKIIQNIQSIEIHNDYSFDCYYTLNELISLINELIVKKNNKYYFKYQNYFNISNDKLEELNDYFYYSYNSKVYKAKLSSFEDKNYLSLTDKFQVEKDLNNLTYLDYNSIKYYKLMLINCTNDHLSYLFCLLDKIKQIINSYYNDNKSLYIIGESESGKTTFKNIILKLFNNVSENEVISKSEFNYQDINPLNTFDDIDINDKDKKQKLILNKDNLSISINEKNKPQIILLKNRYNLIINNDFVKINKWYHQRRIIISKFIKVDSKLFRFVMNDIHNSRMVGDFKLNFLASMNYYLNYTINDLFYDCIYLCNCKNLIEDNYLDKNNLLENCKHLTNESNKLFNWEEIKKINEKNKFINNNNVILNLLSN